MSSEIALGWQLLSLESVEYRVVGIRGCGIAELWRGSLEFIHGRVSTPHAWQSVREGESLALVAKVPYLLTGMRSRGVSVWQRKCNILQEWSDAPNGFGAYSGRTHLEGFRHPNRRYHNG